MRYISAYSKSTFFRRVFSFLQIVILLIPILVVVFTIVFFAVLGKNLPPVPIGFWLSMILMIAMSVGTYVLIRFMLRRMIEVSLDVSSMGIHHLGPGKEKTIPWKEVVEVKIIPFGKSNVALRIKTPVLQYTLAPHLIPDSPDAPRLKFGLGRQVWQFPDGHTEPYDLEHTCGWRIVKEYRPDLLPK